MPLSSCLSLNNEFRMNSYRCRVLTIRNFISTRPLWVENPAVPLLVSLLNHKTLRPVESFIDLRLDISTEQIRVKVK